MTSSDSSSVSLSQREVAPPQWSAICRLIPSESGERKVQWPDASSATLAQRLALWQALIQGQVRVCRCEKRDARQLLLLRRAPDESSTCALSETELVVLARSLDGESGKSIALNTSLSDSRVSDCLRRAAHKVGLETRTDLLRVAMILRGSSACTSRDAQLTPAERDVLRLLGLGLSNRQIAVQRQTKQRTVANQVSSLLRKTGVNGRRSLLMVAVALG